MTAPASRARFEFLVELYLGTVLGWVDITADVRGQIAITRGLSSEGNRANPGSCSLRLNNSSGDYSPRNPAGQWYGYLGRNTPLRVSAGLVGGTLTGRFYGEVSEWPARWSLDEGDQYVDVTASGILRRLGQGEQPALSALRRTIAATDPVAYYPGEDGVLSSSAASAVAGYGPLQVSGTVEFKAIDDYTYNTGTARYGTSALPDLASGGRLSVLIPGAAASTGSGWTVHVAGQADVGQISADLVVMEWATPGGTHSRWQLVVTKATGHTQVIAYDANSGAATTVVDRNGTQLSFSAYAVSAVQNGGNIDVTYRAAAGSTFTGSVAGTLAGVTSLAVNPTLTTSAIAMPFGHLAVWSDTSLPYQDGAEDDSYGELVQDARRSYLDEAAVDRLSRLCTEEDIDLDVTAPAATLVTRMGWQAAATLADLLDQCTAADGGYLYEQRAALGLAYRTRESLYNQTPVPISYSGQLSPPFEPVDDADEVRNDVTVKRTDGSSARSVKTTGRLAALTPPDGVGVYRTEVELNLADDTGLADQAGWRVHLGTVDRPRYPALTVQLAAPGWQSDPTGVAALLAVDTGDVLEVTGLPVWAAGDARTMVLGYTEVFDEWLWSITFAGVPAQPWDVAEADGAARAACDGGTLDADITAGATSLSLAFTAANGRWTTDAGNFPLDLRVGEERVTVSAISGTTSPQTATVSARAVNGVSAAWQAGTEVDVWLPAVAAL